MPAPTPHSFVDHLKALNLPNTFNPYLHHCQEYDRHDAPQVRTDILLQLLTEAQQRPVQSLWLGRDLGHRGGRRTGLALTDDVHFPDHLSRWGLAGTCPTKGDAVSEQTARLVWELLDQIDSSVFLWNIFPLHPHPIGTPFANRRHNANEQRHGEQLLKQLCTIIDPGYIICIGQDAFRVTQAALPQLPSHSIRHPSYGGQNTFRQQITEFYRL